MKQYTILPQQNIYDVAICLYGSIEGVSSLLTYNPSLSIDTELQPGDVINWEETDVLYPHIVDTLRDMDIVPANGERNVYFRPQSVQPMYFYIKTQYADAKFGISGTGTILVDWGDSTPVQTIDITPSLRIHRHVYNDEQHHIIRVYGDCSIDTLYLFQESGTLYPVKPIQVQHLISNQHDIFLRGAFLFENNESILLNQVSEDSVDKFFIYAAEHKEHKKAFNITIYTYPRGEYKAPAKDSSGKYIITTGMEAVYVLTNDPEYNTNEEWLINIGNCIYSIDEQKRGWYLPVTLF